MYKINIKWKKSKAQQPCQIGERNRLNNKNTIISDVDIANIIEIAIKNNLKILGSNLIKSHFKKRSICKIDRSRTIIIKR